MAEEEVKNAETQEQAPEGEEAKPAASGEKVPLPKRIIGSFIDGIIAAIAQMVVTLVLTIVHGAIGAAAGAAVAAGYWLLRDSILGNGQSIGKKAMGYQVVGPDGKPCPQELSIKRNIPLALGSIVGIVTGLAGLIPFLGFLVAMAGTLVGFVTLAIVVAEIYFIHSDEDGNRWGDKFAGTTTKLIG